MRTYVSLSGYTLPNPCRSCRACPFSYGIMLTLAVVNNYQKPKVLVFSGVAGYMTEKLHFRNKYRIVYNLEKCIQFPFDGLCGGVRERPAAWTHISTHK